MGKIVNVICDSCGIEVEDGEYETASIPCHHWSHRDLIGYVDSNMNSVSRRHDTVYLCRPCYNRAWSKFVQSILNEND